MSGALGDDTVEELYEYKNLGVLKNYCGSFASNISDNVDKTLKRAGMIFSSNVDRRKTKPLMSYLRLTPNLLLELEGCQSRFLKKLFYVPDFAPRALLLRLIDLNSIEAEIEMRKKFVFGSSYY